MNHRFILQFNVWMPLKECGTWNHRFALPDRLSFWQCCVLGRETETFPCWGSFVRHERKKEQQKTKNKNKRNLDMLLQMLRLCCTEDTRTNKNRSADSSDFVFARGPFLTVAPRTKCGPGALAPLLQPASHDYILPYRAIKQAARYIKLLRYETSPLGRAVLTRWRASQETAATNIHHFPLFTLVSCPSWQGNRRRDIGGWVRSGGAEGGVGGGGGGEWDEKER